MRSPALLVSCLLTLSAGCHNNGDPAPADNGTAATPGDGVTAPAWQSEVLLDTGSKLSGVVVADIDAATAGTELLAVGTDHRWHLCRRSDGGWNAEAVAQTPGEIIQVAAGDVWPDSDNIAEVVGVGVAAGNEDDPGAKGAAVLLRRDGDGWVAEQIFEDSALLHGVAVEGRHVWVTGYSRRVHRLTRTEEGAWRALTADLPGPGRSIAVAGDGVVIACKDGSVVQVRVAGESLQVDGLHKRDSGRARVDANAAGIVVVCDDDGTFGWLTPGGTLLQLHKADQKLRGAVLADLDPANPGLEAATAGYDGTVRLFRKSAEGWAGTVVATDTDRFHHLTSGELPGWAGTVLVGVNYSGKVTVAGRKAP
jgi:hypothetical protein